MRHIRVFVEYLTRNLEDEGSQAEDTSQTGAREGSNLAGTGSGEGGGLGGRGADGANGGGLGGVGGRGSRGGVGVAGAWNLVLAYSCFHTGALLAHQVLQTTDETVVMGLVTVQGQSVIVRVVAWHRLLA